MVRFSGGNVSKTNYRYACVFHFNRCWMEHWMNFIAFCCWNRQSFAFVLWFLLMLFSSNVVEEFLLPIGNKAISVFIVSSDSHQSETKWTFNFADFTENVCLLFRFETLAAFDAECANDNNGICLSWCFTMQLRVNDNCIFHLFQFIDEWLQ